jgi:PBP1b-binding outer membrane lipoprotein LpoB|tara:strand:- start:336 stop:485 length:150 start_codon:yes stop_codon:yes gene_type:complete
MKNIVNIILVALFFVGCTQRLGDFMNNAKKTYSAVQRNGEILLIENEQD